MTAIVRPDWKMPEHPKEPCPICKKAVSVPSILSDLKGGWVFLWTCKADCTWNNKGIDEEDDWPFVEDTAQASDFEKLGFKELKG